MKMLFQILQVLLLQLMSLTELYIQQMSNSEASLRVTGIPL